MIVTMLSLVAVALLALVLMSTTLHSGSTSSTNIANAPGVGEADSLVAQQSLSTALIAVGTAAASAGGYGTVEVGSLSAADPSVTYVTGPTTGASTVSVALTAGTGSPGGAVGAAISGAEAAGSGAVTGGSGISGTVTLAARSANGTCWLVWRGDGSATWYGAQTGLPSCTAPALAVAPSAGPVSSSGIGWQQGSFPGA